MGIKRLFNRKELNLVYQEEKDILESFILKLINIYQENNTVSEGKKLFREYNVLNKEIEPKEIDNKHLYKTEPENIPFIHDISEIRSSFLIKQFTELLGLEEYFYRHYRETPPAQALFGLYAERAVFNVDFVDSELTNLNRESICYYSEIFKQFNQIHYIRNDYSIEETYLNKIYDLDIKNILTEDIISKIDIILLSYHDFISSTYSISMYNSHSILQEENIAKEIDYISREIIDTIVEHEERLMEVKLINRKDSLNISERLVRELQSKLNLNKRDYLKNKKAILDSKRK